MTERLQPAPDHPGWHNWQEGEGNRFSPAVFGQLLVRMDDARTARIRFMPGEMHLNQHGGMHGGALMGFIDAALAIGAAMASGRPDQKVVMVDAQVQFLRPGGNDHPIDAVIELNRETGRMFFARGLLMQGEDRIVSFSGVMRKVA